MIEDLGSTNGTYLNGNRLTAAERITKGDRVQIGSTVFEAE
jgi:pSer/pThr/pTyr-binding forkhead associated (FHA) protein